MCIRDSGRRIGPFDIRVGIPRDRSLDNVEGDRRLKRTMGGNPESTMGRVISTIAQGEGFAKPNRFMVDFVLPRGVQYNSDETDGEILFEEEIQNSTLEGTMQRETQIQRGLRAFVENVDMPGRTLDTTDYKIYGPRRQVVTGHSFSGEITMSMYCDKFLRQRSFFEMWQKAAFDQGTNNVHFYEEYIGAVRRYHLGAFAENADRDRISYGCLLYTSPSPRD